MYTNWSSATKAIIIVNFLLLFTGFFTYKGISVFYWLAFYPSAAISDKEVWRFITYPFVHQGFRQFLPNMVPFFLLGEPVEKALGGMKLLMVYVLSAVAGAVLLSLANFNFDSTYVGSMAGVYGTGMVYSIIFPTSHLFWKALKVKYIIWFFALNEIFSPLIATPEWVGMGGVLAGTALGFYFKPKAISQQV